METNEILKKQAGDLLQNYKTLNGIASVTGSCALDLMVCPDLDLYVPADRVFPGQVAPMLNSQQIAELREYAEKLPFLSARRKEFSEVARLAERDLQAREVSYAFRESQQLRTPDPSARSAQQSPSHSTASVQLTDRDSLFRADEPKYESAELSENVPY
jgi:hypothetical protein